MTDSLFLDIDDDGIAAGHPRRIARPLLVAPSTGAEFNTLQPQLITVGCALVSDQKFDFDSSFIMPEAARAFRKLVRLVKAKPDCPLSVFGHADPVGRDAYNKTLSGRRAMSVYAVLVRDTEIWEKKLYKQPHGGDKWGTRCVQIMLDALGYPPGPYTGELNTETRDAVEAFQTAHSDELAVDRDPGTNTRKKLFELYMDLLCSGDDGQPFKLEKTDFLAGGANHDGKGDYQGCGEFNPVLLFSEEEQQEFKRDENREARDEANAPNRRVIVFLFERNTLVDPNLWPCPKAKDPGQGCKARFWSDGEDRRSRLLSGEQRQFQKTRDTFGCRFYQGLAEFSPCEAGLRLWALRLQVDGADANPLPLKQRRFVVTAGDSPNAPELRGSTDDQGILRIPVWDELVTMVLKLDVSGYLLGGATVGSSQAGSPTAGAGQGEAGSRAEPPSEGPWEDENRFLRFTLKCGSLLPMEPPGVPALNQRLYNLGYGPPDPEDWDLPTRQHATKAFQRNNGLEPTGDADEPTRQKLKEVHGG